MHRTILIAAFAFLLGASIADAEYLEITASEIATIAPATEGASSSILVRWTLPNDLSTKIIDGAAVTMTLERDTNCLVDVNVYPMTRDWSAASVHWSSGWTRAGGDYNDSVPSPAIASESNAGRISANVYDVIQEQVAGRASNLGFIIVPDRSSRCRVTAISANDASRRADAKLIIAYRTAR